MKIKICLLTAIVLAATRLFGQMTNSLYTPVFTMTNAFYASTNDIERVSSELEYARRLLDLHYPVAALEVVIRATEMINRRIILVILGERWEADPLAAFNWREDGTYPQNYMIIIGTADGTELFSIRKPGMKTEWRKPPDSKNKKAQ